MKKIMGVLIVSFLLAGALRADQLRFVTLLSQPVGVFSRVQLVDANATSKIARLDFCNNPSTDQRADCQARAGVKADGAANTVAFKGLTVGQNSAPKGGFRLNQNTKLGADSTVKNFYVHTFNLNGGNDYTSEDLSSNAAPTAIFASLKGEEASSIYGKVKILHINVPLNLTNLSLVKTKIASLDSMTITNKAVFSDGKAGTNNKGAHGEAFRWTTIACSQGETGCSNTAFILQGTPASN